jgi:WD40 repeat protein
MVCARRRSNSLRRIQNPAVLPSDAILTLSVPLACSLCRVQQSFLSVYCDHDDFIHDLAFDWYGNRLATCSSDQKIKVFDHLNGKWSCTAEIKVRHEGTRGASGGLDQHRCIQLATA